MLIALARERGAPIVARPAAPYTRTLPLHARAPENRKRSEMTRTNNSDPPQGFSVGLVLGRADAARDQYLARHFGHTHNLSVQTFPDDESVVSVLAKLETGDDKERADKAAARLGACGLSSVPSWLRPHKALSNGEAARVDVATCLARHAASQKQFCVVNDFACVVNRDAARSMACAVGKYARRLNCLLYTSPSPRDS